MKEKVILDCDCTFDIPGCDVDDGMAIIYLIGSPNIDLRGVTLEQGNSDWGNVLAATRRLKEHLHLLFSYYFAPDTGEQPGLAASDFLVDEVNAHPHEITLLGTGGLTNIRRAIQRDPLFLSKLKRVVLMGGNCFPLIINGHEVSELNFRTDSDATRLIFASGTPLVIMNGHMTTEAIFSPQIHQQLCTELRPQVSLASFDYYTKAIDDWMMIQKKDLGIEGFCNWDITTAVFLEQPDFFTREKVFLSADQQALDRGQINIVDHSTRLVEMPAHIRDIESFNQLVYQRLLAGLTSTANNGD